MIRRYFVILIMLLSFGSTFLKAEPRINLKNKIQQINSWLCFKKSGTKT